MLTAKLTRMLIVNLIDCETYSILSKLFLIVNFP